MALTAYITPKELERQALTVFSGKICKIWAVYDPLGNLTMDTPAAEWLSARVSDLIEATIGVGTYNLATERYELPPILARFQAGAAILNYTTVCVWVDESTFLHSIQVEDPAIAIPADNYRNYLIYFAQDDGPNTLLPVIGLFEPGRFNLSGGESSWTKSFPEDSNIASPGFFRNDGYSAELTKTFPANTNKATPGFFAITGQEIGYTYTQKAGVGRFEISGQASLIYNSRVQATAFTLTGGVANLSRFV